MVKNCVKKGENSAIAKFSVILYFLFVCIIIFVVTCVKKYSHFSFKCALSKQTRRMPSIKEFIVKKKNYSSELQYFNVTRDFVYQTMKYYKETGCIEKCKYQTQKGQVFTPAVIKTTRERIRRI
jgi:hypothetical protein